MYTVTPLFHQCCRPEEHTFETSFYAANLTVDYYLLPGDSLNLDQGAPNLTPVKAT